MFIMFQGARRNSDDTYTDRGEIWININLIAAFYDHTILIGDKQIWVMESKEEIRKKISKARPLSCVC